MDANKREWKCIETILFSGSRSFASIRGFPSVQSHQKYQCAEHSRMAASPAMLPTPWSTMSLQ